MTYVELIKNLGLDFLIWITCSKFKLNNSSFIKLTYPFLCFKRIVSFIKEETKFHFFLFKFRLLIINSEIYKKTIR